MPIDWDSKPPGAVDNYELDWSKRLDAGDSITGSTWAILGGATSLTIVSNVYDVPSSMTKVWVSGGTVNQSYTLRNTITTFLGATLPQDVILPIKAT